MVIRPGEPERITPEEARERFLVKEAVKDGISEFFDIDPGDNAARRLFRDTLKEMIEAHNESKARRSQLPMEVIKVTLAAVAGGLVTWLGSLFKVHPP